MRILQAVLLDRDGVINVNIPRGYVQNPDMLRLAPGAAESIRKLNDAGVQIHVISNQQGVAKGIMTEEELDTVDAALRAALAAESGAVVGSSYYCMHLNSDDCSCRKPKDGMLREAAAQNNFALSQSVFIGDTPTDIAAGYTAGVAVKILVLSGATKTYAIGAMSPEPDIVAPRLAEAVDWLFKHYQLDEHGSSKHDH